MSKSLNMIPFQYPDEFQNFKNGLHDFWTPFDISMGQDKFQYDTQMPENIKRVALTNLANLTTSDVEIMDNCALGLQEAYLRFGLADSPEVRMVFNLQAFQEALHTLSYQHIIESIGLTEQEQKEFYNHWQATPPMRAKVEYADWITSELMSDKLTAEQLLRYSIFYWLIYEGAWFYGGFNVNFALSVFNNYANTPCMSGTTEQLRYIMRDEENHIRFGIRMIKRLIAQIKPKDNLKITVQRTVSDAEMLESDYIHYLLNGLPIYGYRPVDHMQFFRFIVKTRMNSISFPTQYTDENPFKWRSAFEFRAEKNFFEKRVDEYRVGAQLNWD